MMKRNTYITKNILSLLLVLLLIFVSPLSMAIYAIDDSVALEDDAVPSDDTVELLPQNEIGVEAKDQLQLQRELDDLTCEIEELRTANTKHFKMPDGSYQMIVYGDAVHRKNEEGLWQDIDNTLVLQNIKDIELYATTDGRLQFARDAMQTSELMTLAENGYTVSMALAPTTAGTAISSLQPCPKSSPAHVDNHETREAQLSEKSGLSYIEKLTTLDHTTVVTYANAVQGADIEYVLSSNDIKENIIVKEKSNRYNYAFVLTLEGLTASLENEEIVLRDRESGQAVYVIPAPFMYDANGVLSYHVSYTLTAYEGGAYYLAVTPDDAWMNAEERAFPVTIDPSLIDIAQVSDAYVSSTSPTSNYRSAHDLWVSNTAYTFYKFEEPVLPANTNITSVTVKLPYYYQVTNNYYVSVGIYPVTSSWSETSVTWNAKPTISSTCLDVVNVYANGASQATPAYATFAVTEHADALLDSTRNFGFALKREGGTNNSVIFVSKEAGTMNAQMIVNYTGTHFPDGVYALSPMGTNTYVNTTIPASLGWVLQDTTSHTSPPLSAGNLSNLLKIAYRPATGDYVIRCMLANSVLMVPSQGNNAPILRHVEGGDSTISAAYTWNLVPVDGFYYITCVFGSTTYYVRSRSNVHADILELTTNPNASGTKWAFHQYTGNAIDGAPFGAFDDTLSINDAFQYKAYVSCSRIGYNGPISYSVQNTDGTATDKATINANTGVLQALKPGTIKVCVTYPGAPWIWYMRVSIGGTFVDGTIPMNLSSTNEHLCIPCAITNLASYWCINYGYTGFGCADSDSQEQKAIEIQEALIADHGDGAHQANGKIPEGFAYFSHTESGKTYGLHAEGFWEGNFIWDDIVDEIDAGRPLLLGFEGAYTTGHMTLCVGYVIEEDGPYVWVSDAHEHYLVKHKFSYDENDFIAIVTIEER